MKVSNLLLVIVLTVFGIAGFAFRDLYSDQAIVSAQVACDAYATDAASLDTQLARGSQLSGKTLCLRGGVYGGKFRSNLSGATVRSAPGEWAVLDGNYGTTLTSSITASQTSFAVADASRILLPNGSDEIVIDREIIKFCQKSGNTLSGCLRAASGTSGGAQSHNTGVAVNQAGSHFYASGSNTIYRDFEITNTNVNRTNDGYPEIARGNGIHNVGGGNSFINLIVHETVNGVFTGSGSSNTTVYGVISYNNGMMQNEGIGHGFYLENASGFSKIHESMSINAFNLGFQGYGVTGPYVGGDVQGSVFVGAGTPGGVKNYLMIYGPDSQASPTGVVNVSHFYHQPGSGYLVKFGYGAGVNTGTVTNNYFVGGGSLFEAGNVQNLTFTGNKVYSSNPGWIVNTQSNTFSWNNNSYYNAGTVFAYRGDVYLFSNWKSLTGYDANSTAVSTAMPDTVIVRPNVHQVGRANVIVYAASNPAAVNVDISGIGLVNGQSYTVRNAFNWNGASVMTGVYNGGPVSIPLNAAAKSVATPIGMSTTPATTCPQLCLFVVMPGTGGAVPTPTPLPTVTPTPIPTPTATPIPPTPTPIPSPTPCAPCVIKFHELSGRVTRKNGTTIIAGVEIMITDQDGNIFKTKSATNGTYLIPLIGNRHYRLTATKPGTTFLFDPVEFDLTGALTLNIRATNR